MKIFSDNLNLISAKFTNITDNDKHLLSKEEMKCLDNLNDLSSGVSSPLQHLEHKLHGLIAYFILPIFALSNAGVVISTDYNFNFTLMINIVISLFVGKFVGVALFSYLGLKLKISDLPSGVEFKQILGIASIAGVGFTMSIFIANLAFYGDLISINSVKVGIISGSLISGIIGYIILNIANKK